MANPAYASATYRTARARLLASHPACVHCGRPATEADHQPPLRLHVHGDVGDCCRLVPSCSQCARRQGAILAGRVTSPRPVASPPAAAASPPAVVEPAARPADDPVWHVPWLDGLRRVPADATWPRLMTPPHPQATGSYGAELWAAAEARTGRPLRWWQQLAAARLLEHDADGLLVWDACDLSVARQVGKSWLARELCLWRLDQAGRFGEAQTVVHTGKDLAICVEIQRDARRWARAQLDAWDDPVYKVRDANGTESIERLDTGSRWMVRSQDSVYGLSASLGVVDEAWAVPAGKIEDGLVPTSVERTAAQLLNVSTAHRKATALMLNRRAQMIADPDGVDGDLWLEWSAPPDVDLDDRAGWRMASPHWSARRERLIAQRLAAARNGETDDPDEPDPLASFTAQWLNRWPVKRRRPGAGEPLLVDGVWAAHHGTVAAASAVWLALEDWFGHGAAVAYCVTDGAGRFEVDGAEHADWAAAVDEARLFVERHPGARLIVGKSAESQVPADFPNRGVMRTAGQTETHRALALLRSLTVRGAVVHDVTPDVDRQVDACRVRQLPSGGLSIVSGSRSDVLRAVLWALDAAQVTPPAPAVR